MAEDRRVGWLATLVMAGMAGGTALADDWPQWLGPKRDGVWRETAILDKFPEKGVPARWRRKASSRLR